MRHDWRYQTADKTTVKFRCYECGELLIRDWGVKRVLPEYGCSRPSEAAEPIVPYTAYQATYMRSPEAAMEIDAEVHRLNKVNVILARRMEELWKRIHQPKPDIFYDYMEDWFEENEAVKISEYDIAQMDD